MSDMGYANSVCNLNQFACIDQRGCIPNENVRLSKAYNSRNCTNCINLGL